VVYYVSTRTAVVGVETHTMIPKRTPPLLMGTSQSRNKIVPSPNVYAGRDVLYRQYLPTPTPTPSPSSSHHTQKRNHIDAIYFQCSVEQAVQHLMIGAIRTSIERTGVYNETSPDYPGVTGRVSFDWLRNQPLFDANRNDYEVLSYDVLYDDEDGTEYYKAPAVTFVMSTALLDRKDYHIDIGTHSKDGKIYPRQTYGWKHINKIDQELFDDDAHVASITFHHAVPTDYIQEIWLHSFVPGSNEELELEEDMTMYTRQQNALKHAFLNGLQMIQGLYAKYHAKVVVDRLVYPKEKFTFTPSNHQELIQFVHGYAPNFCFAGTAESLKARMTLIDMKKMAIDCGFSYDDVVNIDNADRLSKLIARRANQLFRGETEDGQPTEVEEQVFNPPFGGVDSTDEPFTREFVISMMAHKTLQHHINHRVPLMVTRREIEKLLNEIGNKPVDLLGIIRNTMETGVRKTLIKAQSI